MDDITDGLLLVTVLKRVCLCVCVCPVNFSCIRKRGAVNFCIWVRGDIRFCRLRGIYIYIAAVNFVQEREEL